jgi:hypothetical protein
MRKQCQQCKEAFDAKDELDNFCSSDDECNSVKNQEAVVAELDSNSDECLSCQ